MNIYCRTHCIKYHYFTQFLVAFFFLGFPSQTFTNHRTKRMVEAISLTLPYHFHPLHRHLDGSSQPGSNLESLVSERKSPTSTLRALCFCGNFVETDSFHRVLDKFTKTLWKHCGSTKFLCQQIG